MTTVLPAILALAAVDALNPTSITGAIYLAGSGQLGRLRPFIAGVYVTYLSIGLALMFGPAAAFRSALGARSAMSGPIVEVVLGGLLVLLGTRAWHRRGSPPRGRPRDVSARGRSGLALGCAATLMDLPTAGPLLLATAILTGLARWAQVTDLGLYNAIYVSPLVAIALVHNWAARPRGRARWLRSGSLACTSAVAAVCVIVGAVIGCQGLASLL